MDDQRADGVYRQCGILFRGQCRKPTFGFTDQPGLSRKCRADGHHCRRPENFTGGADWSDYDTCSDCQRWHKRDVQGHSAKQSWTWPGRSDWHHHRFDAGNYHRLSANRSHGDCNSGRRVVADLGLGAGSLCWRQLCRASNHKRQTPKCDPGRGHLWCHHRH